MRVASVSTGIHAPGVAWQGMGWEDAFFSEIDPFCNALLAEKWPTVPNLGDMKKIDGAAWRGKINLLVGGTPCQAFSVAGNRQSLDDKRGNLALVFTELVHAIDPEWVLWENVPGVLNTPDNAFGCILAGLVGADAPLVSPRKRGGWTDAGMVSGPKRTAAWRVFDAQYIGLAQQRRRVFVLSGRVGDFRPGQVLFEPESEKRRTPPTRRPGGTVAPAVTGGAPFARTGNSRVEVDALVPVVMATGQGSAEVGEDQCPTLNCNHEAPIVFDCQAGASFWPRPSSTVAPTIKAGSRGGGCHLAVAFTQNQSGDVLIGDIAPSMGTNSNASGRNTPKVAILSGGDISRTMTSRGDGGSSHDLGPEVIAVDNHPHVTVRRLTPRECERIMGFPDDYTRIESWRSKLRPSPQRVAEYAEEFGMSNEDAKEVLTNIEIREMAVYLGISEREAREVGATPDGPRYKALGNSIAVPVLRWIGERINKVCG